MGWHTWHGASLVLNLHIQPRARQAGIEGLHGERLRLRLGAPPVDGKANQALIGLLAAEFGVPRRAVRIAQGEHAMLKTVAVDTPRVLPAWFIALGGQACPGDGTTLDSRPRRSP